MKVNIQSVFDILGDIADKIVWGEKMTGLVQNWNQYYFPLYSFSICDVDLFGSFTMAYPASISTTSRCLTVPQQIFENIQGWIPMECPSNDAAGHTHLCWLGQVRLI